MSLAMILPMSAFALAASISPGPVNLVCLSSGTRYPLTQGLVFVTGATLGFIALFIAVGLGLYSALAQVPGRDDGRLPENEAQRAPGFMTGALMQWLNPKAWLASASGIGAYTSGSDLNQVLLFAALYLPICWLSLGSWVYAGAFLRRYVHRPAVLVTINRTLALLLAASCLYLLLE